MALVVRDYDEAIDFYTKTLHFTLLEDTYHPEQEEFIGNQTGGRVFLFRPLSSLVPPCDSKYTKCPKGSYISTIMSGFGADVLWEQHGYPDGCVRVSDPVGDHLDCAERYR